MATLNNIAENIAFTLGEQFNDTLKESIKDSIVDFRAMLIRQDLERNSISYFDYLETFNIALIRVDKSECPELAVKSYVLRSENKVPPPIRLKSNGRSNYKFVGSIDRTISLTFASAFEINFMSSLPFQKNTIYYTYRDGYIYVLNNLKIKKLVVEGIIADPRLVDDCDMPTVYADDRAFPVPVDMLVNIKDLIKRSYPQYIKDGEEVNIEKDDRP